MPEEERRARAPSALAWLLLGLGAAATYLCWPLWPALVLAAWTASLARPILVRLERWLHGRRRAAAVISLVLFLGLVLPLGLTVLVALSGLQEIARALTQAATEPLSPKSALDAITAGTGAAPGAPPGPWPKDLAGLLALVQQYGSQALRVLSSVAGAAVSGLVAVFVYFGSTVVFLLDGPKLREWCTRRAPLKREHLARMAAAFHETGRGLLIGVGLTSATQGLVATLLFLALGVPRWWVLGPITGLASMLPFVGSALVWLPIALGLFLSGHPVRAVLLVVLGATVISTVDNVLRPIYARLGSLEMPSLLLYVSIFGGIAAIGPLGALLGPLVVRLFLEVVELVHDKRSAAS